MGSYTGPFAFIGQQGPTGPTGPGYRATSGNTFTPNTGTQTFATQSGLAYVPGDWIYFVSSGTPTANMTGTVTTYSGTSLVVNFVSYGGSGSHSDWLISLIGQPGTNGSAGAAATIAVNSTTTGAAGSNASVANVGTSSAALLNFTIPQGAQGTGLTFLGAYNAGTAYVQGNAVTYSGSLYAALQSSTGQTPSSSPTYWTNIGSTSLWSQGAGGIIYYSGGNVGIGTSAPTFGSAYNAGAGVLGIAGNGSAAGACGVTAWANINATPASGDVMAALDAISLNNSNTLGTRILSSLLGSGGTNGLGARMRFFAKPDNSATTPEMARMTSAGLSVFPGGSAADPSYPLDVAGIIRSSSGGFQFPDGSKQTTAASITNVSYNFAPQTPGGSLSASSGQVITMSPLPSGITSASVAQAVAAGTNIYLYISGGTGTAEAVPITSVSGSNITVTCANTHSGAWTIQSASGGVQEAIIAAGSGGGTVYLINGTIAVYATIYCPYPVTILGCGMRITALQAQGATIGIFDAVSNYFTIKDCYVTCTVQQTSGGFGVRIGNGTGNEASFCRFENVMFNQLYTCLLGINASNWTVLNCAFYNFSYVGIQAQDTTNPDYDGPVISGCTFLNYSLSAPANAAVLINSSGSVTIVNCPSIQGGSGGSGQLNYGVYLGSSTSSGLTIANNYFQALSVCAIYLSGAWQDISVIGNHSVQPTGMGGTFLSIQGGSGAGLEWGTVTGNDVVGPGGSTTYYFASVGGNVYNWVFAGNTIVNCYFGWYLTQAGNVTIGTNCVASVTFPIYGGLSGIPNTLFINPGFALTYSALPNCAVGSQIYCSDANSTVTAGSSTG